MSLKLNRRFFSEIVMQKVFESACIITKDCVLNVDQCEDVCIQSGFPKESLAYACVDDKCCCNNKKDLAQA